MKKISLKLLYISKNFINQQHLAKRSDLLRYSQLNAGYSLVEMLAVVMMIGILAAILAPNWFAFVNRQQLNKANDAVITAIQETQRQAQRNKTRYSVSFRKTSANQPIQFVIYPTLKPDGTVRSFSDISNTDWKSLGENAGVTSINSKQLLLGANLSSENTAGSSISFSLTDPTKITFDYMATLPNANFGTIPSGSTEPTGLRVVLALPVGSNGTSPSGVRRCVIIRTLLGSIQTAQNNACS
ncbi:prepilin-type N-terminal cleavage/methylation domain-containing protein [Nostoc sp. MS1]|uniref:prepilin-type N-terminal cleavage/methylation domain-containing protein n=1 Tax=Nostoc sp. MS1 TaxID=2764711 RepID=UPI001CC6D9EB|nr:prepilin-type N-terminal cleavage/methylation domain-containing protein [Nostoc sp. MS1]BCL37899.1 hypothetical protein NSMS1_43460 [Nostoc sp. MS1]